MFGSGFVAPNDFVACALTVPSNFDHAFFEDDDESDHEYIFGEADSNNLVACDFE